MVNPNRFQNPLTRKHANLHQVSFMTKPQFRRKQIILIKTPYIFYKYLTQYDQVMEVETVLN